MMLEKAHEQMNAARGARGLAALARPWPSFPSGSAPCLTCHQGVENQAGPFASRAFSHAPHLARATLECAACHRPHEERAPHEVVRFAAAGCVPCHHRGGRAAPSACAKCHGDVTGRTVDSFRGKFSHQVHVDAGLECSGCHTLAGGNPLPDRSACSNCHED